ncbi:DUF3048 domain-containing protein [Aquibacillus salsiterrae]|uniref:DUF3048 domain-containing protein n=1 Tax=Aquibacillus salsiterrae TaxID=2950439 RepID=A0A9X3WFQ6_9BACI|nr:DUF3048 domain-containing protein [Aquibacillus salsiterrae]MDC3417495.1 DUF3048 domain-containing protein [Aquibacillus salsiterrae]
MMKIKQRTLVVMVMLLSMLFVAVACGNDDKVAEKKQNEAPQVDDTKEPAPKQEPEPDPKTPTYKNVYPLTGTGTNDPVDDRMVAVMVNNAPQARPQTGLTKADVVFEILAEGRISRFMALFQSEKPDVVGPIRSARPYFFNLADDYGALYVYHGAAYFIQDMLNSGAADFLNGSYYDNDKYLFKRESFRKPPHNSYLLFDAVYEVAENKGYQVKSQVQKTLPFLADDKISSLTGDAAVEISLNYTDTSIRYVYNSESEKYERFNDNDQTVELETEEPILLDNLFVLETEHQVIDDEGRREVDLASGGKAYLFQKGKVQQVQWENVDGLILPMKDGEPVGFVPGKTWINVIPMNPGLEGVNIQ